MDGDIFPDDQFQTEIDRFDDLSPAGKKNRYKLVLEFLQESVNSSSSSVFVGRGIDLMRELELDPVKPQ